MTIQLEATDPDGDNLTFEAENLPQGATLNGNQFSWTPDGDQVGDHAGIIFRVWDDGDPQLSDEESITITVNAINHPPVLTEIGDQDLVATEEFTLELEATDPDGDNLTFEGSDLPQGSTLEGNLFSWTPREDQVGVYEAPIFWVWDDGDPGLFDYENVTFTVSSPNHAPVLSEIGNLELTEGDEFTLQLEAGDPDGDQLSFEVENLPFGSSLENDLFRWTPAYDQAGVYEDVIFRVWDDGNPSLSDEESITITVANVNRFRWNNLPDAVEVNEDEELRFTAIADNPDEEELTISYASDDLPEEVQVVFNGDDTCTLIWQTTFDDADSYTASFTLSNGEIDVVSDLSITVNNINRSPALSAIGDLEVNENEELTIQLQATDPDNNNLTFEAENLPEGATLEGDQFSWTPTGDQVGVWESLIFRVWDDGAPPMSDEESISVTVNEVNLPPVLSALGDQVVDEGELLTFQLEANDPDGDNLTFEAENLPAGASLIGDVFSWTPGYDQAGVYEGVIFRVRDDGDPSLADEETITITVNNVNRPPVLTDIGDREVDESELLTFQLEATDPDGDNLTFEAENLPAGANLVGDVFSWTPGYDQAGVYEGVIFRVRDDGDPSLTDEETITITVNNVNAAPVLAEIGDQEIDEGEGLVFQIIADDPDDDNLTFEAENLPEGAVLAANLFSWTPGYDQAGVYEDVTIRVWDDGDPRLSDEETITITVNNINRPPVLSDIGDKTIDEDEDLTFQLEANDPDGDNLTFEAENLPAGATLNGDQFNWTPGYDQAGVYEGIIFRVRDDGDPNRSDEETLTITVNNINRPPALTEIGDREVDEDEELTFQLEASDPDGDNLTFEAVNLPAGASLTGDVFSWIPGFDQAGVYEGVVFRVRDDSDPSLADEETITLTVNNVNRPPVLAVIGDQEVDENEELTFQLEATDPDGDNLTFEVENLPAGANLVGDVFSWIPDYDQAGVYEGIIFRIRDDGNPSLADEETISITVNNVNRPPVLAVIGDKEVDEDEELTFQLHANDPDGDNLTFEAENLPDGATLVDDVFNWMPRFDQAGVYENIIFRVSDGGDPNLSDEEAITITVNQVNFAPVLSYIGDLEIDEGTRFNLALEADDPDGDNLTFETENLPEGATFEDNLFAWTPGYEQAGVYEDIVFRVWDDGEPRLFDEETISITVNNINRPPVIVEQIQDTTIDEDPNPRWVEIADLDDCFSDPDGDDLVFYFEDAPEELNMDIDDDNILYFSPEDNFNLQDGVEITVGTDDEQAGMMPGRNNHRDTSPVRWLRSLSVSQPAFTGMDNRLNGVPRRDDVVEQTFMLTITPVNDAPQWDDYPEFVNGNEDEAIVFTVSGSDVDGDELEFEFQSDNLPEAADFVDLGGNSYRFYWQTTFDDAGQYQVSLRLDDGEFDTVVMVAIDIQDVNRPPIPIIDIPDTTINEDPEPRRVVIGDLNEIFRDPDDDELTFDFYGAPDELNMVIEDGILAFSPEDDFNIPDGVEITISADDNREAERDNGPVRYLRSVNDPFADSRNPGRDESVEDTFILTINPVNDPPIWVQPPVDVNVVARDLIDFAVEAFDVDGDELTISAEVPEGAEFTFDGEVSGVFNWQTVREDAGDYEARFSVSDNDTTILTVIAIHVEELQDMTVSLLEGWNLISINIAPTDDYYNEDEERGPGIWEMIDQIRDRIIIVKDESGDFCSPPNNFSNILYWNQIEGYNIEVSEDCEATWTGVQIAADEDLPIAYGWNMIAYFPDYELPATSESDFHVLSPIIEHVIVAKNDMGEFMWPGYGYSDMRPWAPGHGYQVNVDEDVVLNYPAPPDELGTLGAGREAIQVPWASPVCTGSNMSLLVTAISGLPRDGNNLIKALSPEGRLVGQNIVVEGVCGLAVWGDDFTTEMIDGLLNGEAFELRLWNDESGEEYDLSVKHIHQGRGLVYETDGFVALDIAVSADRTDLPDNFYLSGAYPNPFNSATMIAYGLPEASKISIKIYDAFGRLVSVLDDGQREPGNYTTAWDAKDYPAGVYICRMEAKGFSKVRKMVLVR